MTYLTIHIINILVSVQYFISVKLLGSIIHFHNNLVLFSCFLFDPHSGLPSESLILPPIFAFIILFYFRASLTAICHSFVCWTVIWYTLVTKSTNKKSFLCWTIYKHMRDILLCNYLWLCVGFFEIGNIISILLIYWICNHPLIT